MAENATQCFLRISVAGADPKTIRINLYHKQCPKTCHNFASFCASTETAVPPKKNRGKGIQNPKTYRRTEFHRVIPNFMVQGGDYESFDGVGGESFEGGTTFPDESFEIQHDRIGVVSMANRGKNTNGSQFFITLGNARHLDHKHVAFGQVSPDGIEVLQQMSMVETDDKDKPIPMQRIVIVDCGIGNGNELETKRGSSKSSCGEDGHDESDDKSHCSKERKRVRRERDRSKSQKRKSQKRLYKRDKKSYSRSKKEKRERGCKDGDTSEKREHKKYKKLSSSPKRERKERR